MKKLLLWLATWLATLGAYAQTNQAFVQKQLYASDYGTWQIKSSAPNTYQWQPSSLCQFPVPGGIGNFNAVNTNAPIFINDALVANQEVVTPSFVILNSNLCEVALVTTHSHNSFSLQSGTGGLQEALNSVPPTVPYAVQVFLDRNWYTALQGIPGSNAASIIAAAKGSAASVLVDVTQAPEQFYKWNGTSYAALNPAGASIPATGGILQTSGTAGQAQASNAITPSTVVASTSVSSPVVTTSLVNAPNWGTVFFVDGFVSALYPGIGQATVAYTGASNLPLCQSVSYSGNYYIALSATNATIEPGTNLGVWWPVPQTGATDIADCAWYTAELAKHTTHQNQLLIAGAKTYNTNGLVDYVDGSSFDDENYVGIAGAGQAGTTLLYGGAAAIPVINRPTGGANFSPMTMHDFTVNGNATASAAIEVGTIGAASFYNISAGYVAAGADHVIEFGHTGGDAFQVSAHDLNIGVYPDANVPNCAVIAANVVGGSITSYTISEPGGCYWQPNARTVAHLQLRGYGSGNTAIMPCAVMPTGQTITFSGTSGTGNLTNISEGTNTGGSGCSGSIYAQVYESVPVNYGIVFNNSDSHDEHITSYVGDTAGFYVGAGNDTFTHLHPSVIANGIISNVSDVFLGTELDAVFDRGFTFNQPFSTTAASVIGTNGYVGGGRLLPGSTTYYLASSSANVSFGASASLQDDAAGNTGWQEFVTQSGPIIEPADYVTKAPAGMSVYGNDVSAGEINGDYTPTLTIKALTVGAFSSDDATLTGGSLYNMEVPAGYSLAYGGTDPILESANNFSGSNAGKLLYDQTTGQYFFDYISNALVSGYAKGPLYDSDQCLQFATTPTGGAPDVFACRTAANTVSWGAAANGTNAIHQFGVLKLTAAQTTVSCSTSGSAVFSQPLQGSSDKKVVVHLAACLGTASYTYPTAFTNSPSVYGSNNVAAGIASSVSSTAVTVTGTTSTGSFFLEDY